MSDEFEYCLIFVQIHLTCQYLLLAYGFLWLNGEWSPFTAKDCHIKGNNINMDGERIYHVQGDEFYEHTTIKTSKGERWF
jgi:hypothetical protein